MQRSELTFEARRVTARFVNPAGQAVEREIDIRIHPVTGRTCRIAFSRADEKDVGNEALPDPPPNRRDRESCPFCRPQVASQTPRFDPSLVSGGRIVNGESILFPNLYPYGSYSAVSLFDDRHYVDIGTATHSSYSDSFINCGKYLQRVGSFDPQAVYMAITQNHFPSAGGSLLHPHLQINADRFPPNHFRFLENRADQFYRIEGQRLFSSYLKHEQADGARYIGRTGCWEWMAAFAPEGFYEIWGILPGVRSLKSLGHEEWHALARGILNTQRYYRSLGRNGYNFGLLSVEDPHSHLELRAVILARSNYAAWVRSDHTGYELMLGDMTTFSAPEQTAANARPFFNS